MFLVSCTSVHLEREAAESLDFTPPSGGNELISFETGIILPEEWRFYILEDDGALFRFSDPSGTVSGYLEWCATGYPLSDREILDFIEDDLLTSFSIIRIIPGGEESNISYVAEYGLEEGPGNHSLAVVPGERGFYVLELSSESASAAELSSLCARIGSGVRGKPAGYCMRSIPGTFQVHDIGGMWNWAGDVPGGAVLYRYFPGYRLCSAAVFETDSDSLEAFLGNDDYAFFETELIINNRVQTAAAAGRELPEGPELHIFVQDTENYIVSFALEDEEGKFDSETLLSTEEIRSFFLTVITFGGL